VDMDVEKLLLEDAASFTREIKSLDEEGFISRTLAALGIPSDADEKVAPGAGRIQRPAPAGESDPGTLAKSDQAE
jgi:hypothetical protein